MITTRMQDHKTSKWSEGFQFIQLMKNSAMHSGIKRCPYKAMFGQPLKHDLSISKLPTVVLANLETEEDRSTFLLWWEKIHYALNAGLTPAWLLSLAFFVHNTNPSPSQFSCHQRIIRTTASSFAIPPTMRNKSYPRSTQQSTRRTQQENWPPLPKSFCYVSSFVDSFPLSSQYVYRDYFRDYQLAIRRTPLLLTSAIYFHILSKNMSPEVWKM